MTSAALGGQATVEERELLKTLSWWDVFVVALATPGFLIASLGFSIGVLGAWGAVLVWGASMVIGSLQATGLRPSFLHKFEKRGIELPNSLFAAARTNGDMGAVVAR